MLILNTFYYVQFCASLLLVIWSVRGAPIDDTAIIVETKSRTSTLANTAFSTSVDHVVHFIPIIEEANQLEDDPALQRVKRQSRRRRPGGGNGGNRPGGGRRGRGRNSNNRLRIGGGNRLNLAFNGGDDDDDDDYRGERGGGGGCGCDDDDYSDNGDHGDSKDHFLRWLGSLFSQNGGSKKVFKIIFKPKLKVKFGRIGSPIHHLGKFAGFSHLGHHFWG